MSLLETVTTFVADHVVGKEAAYDTFSEPPLARFDSFHSLGINNWWLPSDVGGRAISLRDSVDMVSALSYGDAGLAFTMLISILGTTFVDLFGTDEQRGRLLPPLAKGARYAALAASEHEAGSELMRMNVVAEQRDGKWVLSGTKAFSTNAAFADFVVVVARVPGPARSTYKGFLIEPNTPGFSVLRRWRMIGLRSSATYELGFTDCVVDAANVIEGNGLRALEVSLNASRILIASMAIGIATRARDLVLQYGRGKEVAGAPLAKHPVLVAKLGQLEMQIETMRCVCTAAAAEFDDLYQNDRPQLQRTGVMKKAIVAKMLTGQMLWSGVSMASEALGGFGYTEDSPIGKLVRDARIISIVEAGDDVLRELLFQRAVSRL